MAILLSVLLGISLSAAAGFRVFVPFLFVSMASKAGFLELSSGFSWISSTPALTVFLVATIIEILAYYIPFIDNLLDTVSTPLAVIAGVVLSATVITDMSPMLKWTLAIIAGGGVAATIHTSVAFSRGISSTLTAGVGNSFLSTVENISSTTISILALISPIIAVVIIAIIVVFIIKFKKRQMRKANKR